MMKLISNIHIYFNVKNFSLRIKKFYGLIIIWSFQASFTQKALCKNNILDTYSNLNQNYYTNNNKKSIANLNDQIFSQEFHFFTQRYYNLQPCYDVLLKTNMNLKIGIVDVDYIFSSLHEVRAMQVRLEKTLKEAELKLTKLESNLKEEYKTNIDKENISQEEMQRSAKIYNDKVTEYQMVLREIKSRLTGIRSYNLKIIKNAIIDAINLIAEEKKIDLILYREHLAFAKENLDISTDIMKILEKQKLELLDESEVLNFNIE